MIRIHQSGDVSKTLEPRKLELKKKYFKYSGIPLPPKIWQRYDGSAAKRPKKWFFVLFLFSMNRLHVAIVLFKLPILGRKIVTKKLEIKCFDERRVVQNYFWEYFDWTRRCFQLDWDLSTSFAPFRFVLLWFYQQTGRENCQKTVSSCDNFPPRNE